MTDHVQLLIESRADNIGRIMHRLITGYCQYYNGKYKKVGHVLQGRHKAILCQKRPPDPTSEVVPESFFRFWHGLLR